MPTNDAKTQDVPLDGTISLVVAKTKTPEN